MGVVRYRSVHFCVFVGRNVNGYSAPDLTGVALSFSWDRRLVIRNYISRRRTNQLCTVAVLMEIRNFGEFHETLFRFT